MGISIPANFAMPTAITGQSLQDFYKQQQALASQYGKLMNTGMLKAGGDSATWANQTAGMPLAMVDGKLFFPNIQKQIDTGNADRQSYVYQDWANPDWAKQNTTPYTYNGMSGFLIDPALAKDPNFALKQTSSYRGENTSGGLGSLGGLLGAGLGLALGGPLGLGALGTGALAGGAGGLLSTGDLSGALKGAALGAIGGGLTNMYNGVGFMGDGIASAAAAGNPVVSQAIGSTPSYLYGPPSPVSSLGFGGETFTPLPAGGFAATAQSVPSWATTAAGTAAAAPTSGLVAANLAGAGAPVFDAMPTAVAGAAANTANPYLELAKGATGALTSGGFMSAASPILNGISSVLQNNATKDAAQQSADAQIRAAQIAADAAKFRPVGVTTRFGSSKFGYDANGNLISAGYNLAPDVKAQQDALMKTSNGMLNQFTGSQALTAPMLDAAQREFLLGNGYLSTDPMAQAQKYYADQQALMASGDAAALARLRENLNATGRGGISIGGDAGMLPSNPELSSYYNSLQQRNLGLAADATQGGMDYAKFGAGMVGLGSQTLQDMYGTQRASYSPYNTAIGGAQDLESLGSNALDLGTSIGAKTSTANANAGLLQARGLMGAAQTMQPINSISNWADILGGAAKALPNIQWGQ